MTANFQRYTEPLKGMELFAAFLPLDPRQGEWYDKGFSYMMEISILEAFPPASVSHDILLYEFYLKLFH